MVGAPHGSNALTIVRARCVLVVDRVEAYPEEPGFVRRDVAVLGDLTAAGAFRSELGAAPTTDVVAQTSEGVRFEVWVDPAGTSWLVR